MFNSPSPPPFSPTSLPPPPPPPLAWSPSEQLSPILGFLGAGVLLNRLGLVQNVDEFSAVSQLGIIFLLFQMGLELSLDRLKDLARFSFGLGLSQVGGRRGGREGRRRREWDVGCEMCGLWEVSARVCHKHWVQGMPFIAGS